MTIEIPGNIEDFANKQKGSVISWTQNCTDAINGYGCKKVKVIEVKLLEKKCVRCGCSSLFSSNDEWLESRCSRHTYEKTYQTVFAWREHRRPEEGKSLKACFDEWLRKQTDDRWIYEYYDEEPI